MGEADFNQFPVYWTKKSISCCSRQLSQRTKSVRHFFNLHCPKHGRATEACSRGDGRCGLPKQKDLCDTAAIQGGQPRDLFCSSLSLRTEEGGIKFSTNCVCQL